MLLFIIIFSLIFFVYIHLLLNWKVSNEIDIPHILTPDKERLEIIADMRQPFIFEKHAECSLHLEGSEKQVNIRKMKELPIKISHKGMLSAIKKEPYLSEDNKKFLNELPWEKEWSELDTYLKPHMNWKIEHDIIYGNKGVYTDLKYSMNNRNYICVLEGNIELKLLPPCSTKALGVSGETTSQINIWVQSESDKKCLKDVSTILIPLKKGSILHIPAYWWFTIKMNDFSTVLFFSYSTYMNRLSQVPHTVKRLMKKASLPF